MELWTEIYEYTTPLLEFEGYKAMMDFVNLWNIVKYWEHNELCMACVTEICSSFIHTNC